MHLFLDKRMIECRTESLIIFCVETLFVFLSLFFYGLIILPMKRGAPASSLHSIRTKGCRAAKEEKEREKEMLVAAAASTPFSVSERKALWRASEMNDSDSSGNIPHKLGFKKSSDKPEEKRGEGRRIRSWLLIHICSKSACCYFFPWNTKWEFLKCTCSLFSIHCCQKGLKSTKKLSQTYNKSSPYDSCTISQVIWSHIIAFSEKQAKHFFFKIFSVKNYSFLIFLSKR